MKHTTLINRFSRSIAILAFIFLHAGCSDSTQTFSYSVRVQAKGSGLPIANARVTLDVPDKAPLDENTDTNGFTRITVGTAYTDRPGVLRVAATGYRPYVKNIDLSRETLPDLIELDSAAGGSGTPNPSLPETPAAATLPGSAPVATASSQQTAPSDTLPTINWGGFDRLFAITDLKIEHQKPLRSGGGSVVFVDNLLTFVVEAKSDFSLTFCSVSLFDSDHIKVDSAGVVSLDPDQFSWTKGDRSRGSIILPTDMSQVQMITVEC